MRRNGMFCCIFFLGAMTPLWGQILHSEAKEKRALEAETVAKEIASGSLFEKELRNLDTLSRVQIDGQIALARTEYLTALDSFTTWGDIRTKLSEIEKELRIEPQEMGIAELEQRRQRIKELQAELQKSAAKIQAKNTGNSVIESILGNLDKGEPVLKFAQGLAPGSKNLGKALDAMETALEQAQALFDAFAAEQEKVEKVEATLAGLQIAAEQTELELLAQEAKSLQRQGIITARQELESGMVLDHITLARNMLRNAAEGENITDTLRNNLPNTEQLGTLLFGLHEAAAAVVRNTLPKKLADLRRTQEVWLLSVQSSSVSARAYEQILRGAGTRLALYYKGGIKPGQIAQLLFNLSGLVSLPILATK